MGDFNDFFVANAGAAAALAGLIFVGVSINLKQIVGHPSLPTRASLALVLLMAILVSSLILLTHLTNPAAGVVLLVTGICLWLTLTIKDAGIYKKTPKKYRIIFLSAMVVDQFAALPYAIGGLCLITNWQGGIYFVVTAYVLSFIKAVWDAWILIIEILR